MGECFAGRKKMSDQNVSIHLPKFISWRNKTQYLRREINHWKVVGGLPDDFRFPGSNTYQLVVRDGVFFLYFTTVEERQNMRVHKIEGHGVGDVLSAFILGDSNTTLPVYRTSLGVFVFPSRRGRSSVVAERYQDAFEKIIRSDLSDSQKQDHLGDN